MSKCREGAHSIAHNLGYREHRYGQDRSRNSPHPKPEHQGHDHQNGVEGETLGEKYGCHCLAFYKMDCEVQRWRDQCELWSKVGDGVKG